MDGRWCPSPGRREGMGEGSGVRGPKREAVHADDRRDLQLRAAPAVEPQPQGQAARREVADRPHPSALPGVDRGDRLPRPAPAVGDLDGGGHERRERDGEPDGRGAKPGGERPRALPDALGSPDPGGAVMSRRTERMSDLLRAELSDLILRETKDPRIRLVSLTGVEVTSDLRRAVVRVSALGDDKQREEAVEAL